MPTISSTLKMFDAMSGPIARVLKQMNSLTESAERLNRTMTSPSNVSLVPAKTIGDQNKVISANQQIIHMTQVINNNYQQINRTINQQNIFLRQTNNTINQAAQSQQNLNSALKQGEKSVEGMWSKIKGLAAAYLSFKGIQGGLQAADTFISTQARLGLIIDEGQTVEHLQNNIFAAAQRARGDFVTMAASASKLGLLAGDAFTDTNEIVAFTETMQKAFKVSGASTMEQQAGMYQLSQAMAAGKLQGDEFRSIMENAPMLADAIAKFTGKSKGELKEMSAEGLITADIIKAALFTAADDINKKFESLPKTFSDVWQQFKNDAFRFFEPVFRRLNGWLNSPQGTALINQINVAVSFLATTVVFLIDSVVYLISAVQSGWSIIEPILIAAAMVFFPLMIAKLWAMIPPLYAQAVAWLAINWPILAVIAAIALVLFILNQLGISADQILGAIAGAFLVLASVIWNTVVGVINAVIQFLWTAFVEPWIGIIEWVLNVFNGGFNSFGDAVKNLLGQIISWFLSLGKVVTKIIDAIFGTDWTSGLESLQDSLLKWGKNEQAITLSREAPMIDARIDYGDAWNKGYRWGSDLADSFKGLTKSFDTAANNLSWPQSGKIPGGKLPDIDKVKKVGKIEDKVDISSEDLKTMRELAEMKSIQNFVTLTPTLSFGDTHIRQDGRSVDEIIERITVRMNEELAASAKGLFS